MTRRAVGVAPETHPYAALSAIGEYCTARGYRLVAVASATTAVGMASTGAADVVVVFQVEHLAPVVEVVAEVGSDSPRRQRPRRIIRA